MLQNLKLVKLYKTLLTAKNNIDDTLVIEEAEIENLEQNTKIQPKLSVNPQNKAIEVDTKKSLTDNFKNSAENTSEETDYNDNPTWIGGGFDAIKKMVGEKKDNPLSEALEQGKNIKKKYQIA